MTRQEIVDLLDRWLRAFDRRDLDAYAGTYALSAKLDTPLAGTTTGRAAVKAFTEAFLVSFPDATITSEQPIIDGDRVAVPATLTGTDVGGFMGLAPSGRAFRLSLVFLLLVRDGEIVEDQRIYDFTGFMVQLGVLKTKPA